MNSKQISFKFLIKVIYNYNIIIINNYKYFQNSYEKLYNKHLNVNSSIQYIKYKYNFSTKNFFSKKNLIFPNKFYLHSNEII